MVATGEATEGRGSGGNEDLHLVEQLLRLVVLLRMLLPN